MDYKKLPTPAGWGEIWGWSIFVHFSFLPLLTLPSYSGFSHCQPVGKPTTTTVQASPTL